MVFINSDFFPNLLTIIVLSSIVLMIIWSAFEFPPEVVAPERLNKIKTMI